MNRRYGPWILLERLGTGGMGEVFKARSAETGRVIALKLLRTDLSKDPEFVERFQREARAASLLKHSRIVEGIDVGEADGRFYFAMELVDGETLAAIIKRDGRIAPARALAIAAQMAEALDAAERHGILHRDVKPANILVAPSGEAKLADLGLAKNALEKDPESSPGERAFPGLGLDPGETLTRLGAVVGTPYYMSPEQALGEDDLDVRSDIYALGATLAHALTGQSFYHGSDLLRVIAQVSAGKFPKFSEQAGSLPPNVVALVEKMTAPDRRFRPPTAAALLEDIRRVERGQAPIPAPDPDAEPISAIMESPPPRPTLPRHAPRARSSALQPALRRTAPGRRAPLVVAAGVALAAALAVLLSSRTQPAKPPERPVAPPPSAAGLDGKEKEKARAGEGGKEEEKGTEPVVVDVKEKAPGPSGEEKAEAAAEAKRKEKGPEEAKRAEDEKKARTMEEDRKRKEKEAREAEAAAEAKRKEAEAAMDRMLKPFEDALAAGRWQDADRLLADLAKKVGGDEALRGRVLDARERFARKLVDAVRKAGRDSPLWKAWSLILLGRFGDTAAVREARDELLARPPEPPPGDKGICLVRNGLGAMEAEDALAGSPKAATFWRLETARPGYQGAGYLASKPGTGKPTDLVYLCRMDRAGIYTVWSRVSPGDEDWKWVSMAQVFVPSAPANIKVGFSPKNRRILIDRVVVSADSRFRPEGVGPPASPKAIMEGGLSQPVRGAGP